jgi:hypothetical protein
LQLVDLLPVLSAVTSVPLSASEAAEGLVLKLDLVGQLLGRDADDVFVALYQAGQTIRLSDEVITLTPPPATAQSQRQARFRAPQPLPSGTYRVILRVNGQQARRSLEVTL